MSEQPKPRRRRNRFVVFVVAILALAALGLGGWAWWKIQEPARLRAEAHRGLEGVWVDDSGQDISYQFRKDGEFLVRQKIPGTLAPFTGDPGVEHRPVGKWSRTGTSVSVQAERNWGFDLILGEDGGLRGDRVFDQWSAQGEYSQTKVPVVLKRKP